MRLLITNQNVSLNTWYRICSPERHLKQNLITRILYKWCVMCVCVCVQSCLTLCDPMDCNSPGFSVHWLLQARILEWVAMPSPGDLSNPGIEPASLMSPAWAGRSFSLPLCHLGTQYKWKASFDSDLVVIVKYSTDMILTYYCHDQIIPALTTTKEMIPSWFTKGGKSITHTHTESIMVICI